MVGVRLKTRLNNIFNPLFVCAVETAIMITGFYMTIYSIHNSPVTDWQPVLLYPTVCLEWV